MLERAALIWRSQLFRSVATIASGTAGAQAIAIVLSPLIARMYGPEAIGVLGSFLAIMAIAAPISALTYPVALVLPRSDIEAVGILWLSGCIALTVSGTLQILLLTAEIVAPDSVSNFAAGSPIHLIPAALLIATTNQMARQWLIRKLAFGAIAMSALAHSLFTNSLKVAGGLLFPNGTTLIIFTLLGYIALSSFFLLGIIRTTSLEAAQSAGHPRQGILKLARIYSDFPLYRAPQDLLNAVSQSLPIILLASTVSPAAAGFYTLSRTVVSLPVTLIGASFGEAYYPLITKEIGEGRNVAKSLMKATAALIAIGGIPFLSFIAFGPSLFELAFGSDWSRSGQYAQWLSLFYLFNLINKPCVAAVPALGIQRGLLFYEIFSTCAKLIAFMVGIFVLENDIIAVAAFSVVGIVAYTAMIAWIIFVARTGGKLGKTS